MNLKEYVAYDGHRIMRFKVPTDHITLWSERLCDRLMEYDVIVIDVPPKEIGTEFRDMLASRCEANGNKLVITDMPTSKKCSKCDRKGTYRPGRKFVCYACGIELDRDSNASINLYRYGREVKHDGD